MTWSVLLDLREALPPCADPMGNFKVGQSPASTIQAKLAPALQSHISRPKKHSPSDRQEPEVESLLQGYQIPKKVVLCVVFSISQEPNSSAAPRVRQHGLRS